ISLFENKDTEGTELFFEKAIDIFLSVNDYDKVVEVRNEFGQVLIHMGKYSKAISVLEDSKELSISKGFKRKEGEALYLIGTAWFKSGKQRRGISPAEEALLIAEELRNDAFKLKCFKLLEGLNRALGKDEADVYALSYSNLKAKLNEQKVLKSRLDNLTGQVDQMIQEKDIVESDLNATTDSLKKSEAVNIENQMKMELQDMTIQAQEANIRSEKVIRNSLLVGVVLFLAFGVVLWKSYQNKKRDNKEIHRQHENISRSINYARRIQEAMLDKEMEHYSLLNECFILFKPRDVVSGDFYWLSELPNENGKHDFAIAAVDCTGHGVPGAFMSMVGMNSLNGAVSKGISAPDQILHSLHLDIYNSLKQEKNGNNDGMDMALCVYRKEENVLEFAGAKNPLVYIQDGKLNQIKGDLHPIGGAQNGVHRSFKSHRLQIEEETTVYMFSDGFQDQFGGPKNKKYMSKRFKNFLLEIHNQPMEMQKELLEKEIELWKGEVQQTDDILVMGFRLSPEK
ncbi:MAG: SpoIIE family protein phosphatase, partial [Cyclobacteriaceae bacterium]|nr:SpoIIE family protein phosphatase [Cyclobacteriaceae bacterium]